MTNKEFLEKMDNIYQHYEESSIWKNPKITEALRDYLIEHIEDDELNPKIHIKDYQIIENGIYLYTDIGTFLMESKNQDREVLETLKNNSLSFLDFFYKLDRGNLSFTFTQKRNDILFRQEENPLDCFDYYLFYYYNYRNLMDARLDRLFKSYNDKNYFHTLVSLEALSHKDFHDFSRTSLKSAYRLKKIYDNYYPFDQNQKLVFSIFLLTEDYEKLDYIKENLEAFKKFVVEEVSRANYLSGYIKICCSYLQEADFIRYFSKEELDKMYQKNTSYYRYLPEVFQETVSKFENKSPMIYLDSTEKEKVHVRYLPHQLIEGVPFDYHIRYNIERGKRLDFKNLYLYNNESMSQFYLMYFKEYQKGLENKGNLFDFIGYLFQTKPLVSLYNNPNISVGSIHELEQFLPFYDKKVQQNVSLAKKELEKRNLAFYNSLVMVKDNKEKLVHVLEQNGLKEETMYSFIIQNKFLDRKKKDGLFTILKDHFESDFIAYDILSIIDEAKCRHLSLDKVLEEKEISKSTFHKMHQAADAKNPILSQNTFENLQRKERKSFLQLMRFGRHIASTNIKSMEEYGTKFPNSPSYYDLIEGLQDTSIAEKLMEKANTFEDFDSKKVCKQFKKK